MVTDVSDAMDFIWLRSMLLYEHSVLNRFFMKLFQTNNIEIVRTCQEFFGFELRCALLPKRVKKFENRFCNKSVLSI